MSQTSIKIKTHLDEGLKSLCLATMRHCYKEQADIARREGSSYESYLLELVDAEVEARREKRIARYLRDSRLPLEKQLASFERKRLSASVDAQLSALLDGSFLSRCENVLAFGNPGSGKTHLLCALAQELIHQGHRIKFMPCSLLVQELLIAK